MSKKLVRNIILCGASFFAGLTTYRIVRRKKYAERIEKAEDFSNRTYIDLTETNAKQEERINELEEEVKRLEKKID